MRKAIATILSLLLAISLLSAQNAKNGVLVIPDGTTEIKGGAYYGLTDFTKVVIPSSVTKIGDLAFHKCTALKEVDIPSSVKSIGAGAFQNCTSLTKVTLHEGLEKIDFRAFKNTALTEVTLPASVKETGREAFMDCPGIVIRQADGTRASTPASSSQPAPKAPQSSASASKSPSALNDGFIHVEGGSFTMGSNSADDEYEKPAHRVTVSSFYICDHEVTQAEYTSVRYGNPSRFKGEKRPVDKVHWYDAIAYCNKLSQKKGLTPCYKFKGESDVSKWGEEYTQFYNLDYDNNAVTCDWTANGYRLPTEAEWEFAARGGNLCRGYTYSGSNNIDEVAWYSGNSDKQTHEVKQKKPNELGLYDMTGNVDEWVWDWYALYPEGSETNPRGYSDGIYSIGSYIYRVYRGGHYESDTSYGRISKRSGAVRPYKAFDIFGFRVVRNDPAADHTYRPARKNPVKSGGDMILVEGGTFRMGSASAKTDEKPVHNVTVGSFYICDHEVTQAEFKEIMHINPVERFQKGDSRPADEITWYEAVLYCNLLSQAKGLKPCYSIKGNTDVRTWEPMRYHQHTQPDTNWDELIECDFSADGYRLPTEAEWEFAARGGNLSKGYRYSGSNEIGEVGWYAWNTFVKDIGVNPNVETFHHEVRDVKTKKPNELGLYDMTGNVCEWCWDRFAPYNSQSQTNPTGPKEVSRYRILRGGGCSTPGSHYTEDMAKAYCTVTVRYYSWASGISFEVSPGVGFRVARTAK